MNPPAPVTQARTLISSLLPLALLLLLVFATAGAAQETRFSADLRIGLSHPKGDLGDLHDDGFFAGLGLEVRVGPRFSVGLDGGFESLERGGRPDLLGGVKGPLADLWHLIALVRFELTDPAGPWHVRAGAGPGLTWFDVKETSTFEAQSGSWPTLHGSFRTGYDFSRHLEGFVDIGGYLMLGRTSDPDDYLGKEIVFVNAFGLAIHW